MARVDRISFDHLDSHQDESRNSWVQSFAAFYFSPDVQILSVRVAKGLGDGGLSAKHSEEVVKNILHGHHLAEKWCQNFFLYTIRISD